MKYFKTAIENISQIKDYLKNKYLDHNLMATDLCPLCLFIFFPVEIIYLFLINTGKPLIIHFWVALFCFSLPPFPFQAHVSAMLMLLPSVSSRK